MPVLTASGFWFLLVTVVLGTLPVLQRGMGTGRGEGDVEEVIDSRFASYYKMELHVKILC